MLESGEAVRYVVILEARAEPGPADGRGPGADDLERQLDELMTELQVSGADDATVSATLAAGLVEVSVNVEASTLEDALARGSHAIRSAMGATGPGPPSWGLEWLSARASKVGARLDQEDLAPA